MYCNDFENERPVDNEEVLFCNVKEQKWSDRENTEDPIF